MKTIIHKSSKQEITISSFTEDRLVGCFFGKEKPEAGDRIMSQWKNVKGTMKVFEVEAIVENRDAKISSYCTRNPENAFFKLKIRNITKELQDAMK
jgi:hypothetical protein